MTIRLPFILTILALCFFACSSTNSNQAQENTEPSEPKANQFTDSLGMNTIAFLSGKNQIRGDAFGVVMNVEHSDEWFPVTTDQLPWYSTYRPSPEFGVFISFFRKNSKVELRNPYIQMGYFSRNLGGVSTPDSNFYTMENVRYPNIEVLDSKEIKTNYGKMAICRTYYLPPEGQKTEKYLAYAFIEYSNYHMISFVLTTLYKEEFDLYLPDFYALVKTYQEV